MRTFNLPQAIHNWFWLLFFDIYFKETTVQTNMAVIYIQMYLFYKYKRYGRIYFETWHFDYGPVSYVFEKHWIASYFRLLYFYL